MLFHINATMPAHKSGIEHAELKRIKLFAQKQVPQRLVLREWDPKLHLQLQKEALPDALVLNMFDFYQRATMVPWCKVTARDLDFGETPLIWQIEPEQQRWLISNQADELIARVHYYPDDQQVRLVEWFDTQQNLYKAEYYDWRGFPSMIQWYTANNQVSGETWLDVKGHPVIENYRKYTMGNPGNLEPTHWQLQTENQQFQFDTLDELTAHFLNQINHEFWSAKTPNIFILDRAHLGDAALLNLDWPAYTVLHLHNAQTSNAQEPLTAPLNQHYEYALHNLDRYNAVVSATPQQTRDLQTRFHPKSKLWTIPVGIVNQRLSEQPRIPVAQRQYGKIVAFARIAPEKQLVDLVRAVGLAHQQNAAVSLDLYGYADPTDQYRARREIEAVIQDQHLEQVVQLKGYTDQIDAIEHQAMLYGLTSRMEGFNLALLEGISHGLIGVTYDVNYGPNEIIQDDWNGRVVAYQDYEALAQAILDILADPQLAQRYSTGAYESAQRYSEEQIYQDWEALFQDAAAFWAELPEGKDK
ncbi:hypothetical protein IV73_GL001014 [Weissella kandleri]|uniref:Glycosyl transferase family 1 domain-containing protein n=1 Tax=Weissella kandleri TaxID=1616 RepID=A0A0R2JC77_9LACO|nr:accessory Sec system glycosyltransferase Asp1 [Weissella kandleri]KRN74891.1 hypothetical protein IV73_GL001014 [Weissella kandleri]